MAKKVYILKGLPASGKSSIAEKMLREAQPNSIKRINKDLLREMFDFGVHTGKSEGFIILARNLLIDLALTEGMNVIVDDTNLNPVHESAIRNLVSNRNRTTAETTQVIVQEVHTPIEECIERDLKRPNSVGEKVIKEMYNKWMKPKWAPAVQNPDLPNAIIVDIDGTIAEMIGRSPYDWERVGEDEPKYKIIKLIQAYTAQEAAELIFVSGRDGICYQETEQWLKDNLEDGELFKLFMRPVGDPRPDQEVKLEIYNNHIKDQYHVDLVFDDRLSVCRLWHGLGLQLLRVGDPEADF